MNLAWKFEILQHNYLDNRLVIIYCNNFFEICSCKFKGSPILLPQNFELDFEQGLMRIILNNDKPQTEKLHIIN